MCGGEPKKLAAEDSQNPEGWVGNLRNNNVNFK